jgi:3-phenylpropionate/trans-cinnamate dioxygenase ferredoxin subunit
MGAMVEVAEASELKNGSKKKVDIQGTEILLAKVEGKYYAVQNKCPHFGGDLSKGELLDTTIVCPNHKSKFDLRDGRVIRWTDWTGIKLKLAKTFRPSKALKSYPIKEVDGKIFLELK